MKKIDKVKKLFKQFKTTIDSLPTSLQEQIKQDLFVYGNAYLKFSIERVNPNTVFIIKNRRGKDLK